VDRRVAQVLGKIGSEGLYLRPRLPVIDLARDVGLSPSRLAHIFKIDAGVSLGQFARALRLDRAKELLESTHLSVKEIAGKVGICHASHFVHQFQKVYGVPPGSHRRRTPSLDPRMRASPSVGSRHTIKAA